MPGDMAAGGVGIDPGSGASGISSGSGFFSGDIGGPIFVGDPGFGNVADAVLGGAVDAGGVTGEIPGGGGQDTGTGTGTGSFDPMAWWTDFFGDNPGFDNPEGWPGSLWGVPEYPSAVAAYSELQPWAIPELPMFDYEGMDPTLKASIERPFIRSLELAREQLGGQGRLGSAGRETPLFSGAAGQVLGELAEQAGPVMARTAYDMWAPMAMQDWEAQLNRNITGFGLGKEAIGQDLAGEIARRSEVMAQNQLPYSILPGLLGGTYSTPIVEQNQGLDLAGGITGAALPFMFSSMNPWLSLPLGLAGLLG